MIKDFELYVNGLLAIYTRRHELTLDELLRNEKKVLDSQYRGKIGNYPRVLHALEQKILRMLSAKEVDAKTVVAAFVAPQTCSPSKTAWSDDDDKKLSELKAILDKSAYDDLSTCKDIRILAQCYLDLFETLKSPIVEQELLSKIQKAIEDDPNFFGQNESEAQFALILPKSASYIIAQMMIFVSKIAIPNVSDLGNLILRLALALTKRKGEPSPYLAGRSLTSPGTLTDLATEFNYFYQFLMSWQKSEPARVGDELAQRNSSLGLPRATSQPVLEKAKDLSRLGKSTLGTSASQLGLPSPLLSPGLKTKKWHDIKAKMTVVCCGVTQGGMKSTGCLSHGPS
jgi:hypothetical protein